MLTNDINVWLRVVAPLLTISITLVWWLVLVLIQSPRKFWRDALNISIVGVLATTSMYLISRALVRAGIAPIDTQAITIIGAVFALFGWPQLARETARLRERRKRKDDLP